MCVKKCDAGTCDIHIRYHEMKGRSKGKIFRAEFHAVDCTVSFAEIIFYNSRINTEATSERVLQESRARV